MVALLFLKLPSFVKAIIFLLYQLNIPVSSLSSPKLKITLNPNGNSNYNPNNGNRSQGSMSLPISGFPEPIKLPQRHISNNNVTLNENDFVYRNICSTLNQTNKDCFEANSSQTSEDDGPKMNLKPLWQLILLGGSAGALIIMTIIGNCIVVLSFIIDRAIRQPTNYFIASLACSDLFIGFVSMPFYTIYLLTGQYWPLGPFLCDLWLAIDYSACMISIYTVFCITIDRFCSVVIPAKYRNWRTEKTVKVTILITWVVPTAIFFTTIYGWQYFVGERTVKEGQCYVQYMEDAIFNCLLQVGYFWVTLLVMCVLYTGIYKVALQIARKSAAKHKKMTSLVSMAGQTMTKIGIGMSRNINELPALNENLKKSANPTKEIEEKNKATVFTNQSLNDKNETEEDKLSSMALTSSSSNRSPNDKEFQKRNTLAEILIPPLPSNIKLKKSEASHCIVNSAVACDSISDNCFDGDNCFNSDNCFKHKEIEQFEKNLNKLSMNGNNHLHKTYSYRKPKINDAISLPNFDAENLYDTDEDINYKPVKYSLPANEWKDRNFDRIDQFKISQFMLNLDENNAYLSKSIINELEISNKDDNEASPVWKRRHSVPFNNPANFDYLSLPELNDQMNNKSSSSDSPSAHKTSKNHINALITVPAEKQVASFKQEDEDSRNNEDETDDDNHNDINLHNEINRTDYKIPNNDKKAIIPLLGILSAHRCKKKTLLLAKEKIAKVPKSRSENRARKALRTITIILGAFVLCWTPWHICSMIIGFCPPDKTCIPSILYDISYWLCYLNSPVNPFCYALANQQFKKTFSRILKFDFHKT